ncbi:MAG: DinB family protein [Chloroflexi bacterium]|nr:DinB family protein [Chloroflexota bacterium]
MDIRDFVVASIIRTRNSTLNTVKDLAQEELAWKPAPFANTIGFLLWHSIRTEDRYIHQWLGNGAEDVWKSEGWNKKWRMPEPHPGASQAWFGETGNSWTPEQVAGWPIPPKEELLAYGVRSQEKVIEVIRAFDLEKINIPVQPDRPNVTYANYLYIASHHEAQHQAQIDYIIGLKRGVMGV